MTVFKVSLMTELEFIKQQQRTFFGRAERSQEDNNNNPALVERLKIVTSSGNLQSSKRPLVVVL